MKLTPDLLWLWFDFLFRVPEYKPVNNEYEDSSSDNTLNFYSAYHNNYEDDDELDEVCISPKSLNDERTWKLGRFTNICF